LARPLSGSALVFRLGITFYDLFLASCKAGEQKQKVCLPIQTSFALVFMEQNHSLGHLSFISSAIASGSALKVPRAKALHFLA